jgi:hypothetical protein
MSAGVIGRSARTSASASLRCAVGKCSSTKAMRDSSADIAVATNECCGQSALCTHVVSLPLAKLTRTERHAASLSPPASFRNDATSTLRFTGATK